MKLGTLILLLTFMPRLVLAQDAAPETNASAGLNERAIASQSQTDRYQQIAYADPADTSLIELHALVARKKFASDPNLYSEIKRTYRSETGLIEDWRERVFKTVGTHSLPQQSDLLNDSRLQSNNEIDDQANAGRTVTRTVIKETLKFTQERLPEIDKLIRKLRFEVSTGSAFIENAGTDNDDEKNNRARAARNTPVKESSLLKTGLRVPVESGKLVLTSETEARFGKVTSFFTVRLDGHYDNSVGLKYAFAKDLHLQVERQVAHTTDFVTSDTTNARTNLSLIQLVCKF
jgi:hypothetical protein